VSTQTLALDAEGLTKDYTVKSGLFAKSRTLHALRDISIALAPGEILGLVGESGCGKSTLAKMLLGLETPTTGRIRIAGRSLDDVPREERARLIQPIFQDPYSSLNPRQTIGRIIGMPLVVQGRGDSRTQRQRVEKLMELVGLSPSLYYNYPNQLSGGQRQRVAIARALILEPQILICDEPTSALDVSVQAQILNLLQRLHATLDLTILLISHNLAVVHHLVRRVAVMYLGRVVEEGPAREVFNAPRHPYTRMLLESVLVPKPGQGVPRADLNPEFPNPLDPPSGCAFHPRCSRAQPACKTTSPALTEQGGRRFACAFPL
jgi:peptide/nickel transport system ATP-binding protein